MRTLEALVAAGVIGQYAHEWKIVKVDHLREGVTDYTLYLAGAKVNNSYPSVLDALKALINHLDEE